MQINLTGFMAEKTPGFTKALWKILLEAQANPLGIPQTFLDKKKDEILKKKVPFVSTDCVGVALVSNADFLCVG